MKGMKLKRLITRAAIAAALVAFPLEGTADATSLKDFWQSREADAPRFESTKSVGALEMCLGMEMSEVGGPPSVLHGEREVILTSMAAGAFGATNPIYGFRVVDHGAARSVIVGAVHSGGWRDRASALAQRCL